MLAAGAGTVILFGFVLLGLKLSQGAATPGAWKDGSARGDAPAAELGSVVSPSPSCVDCEDDQRAALGHLVDDLEKEGFALYRIDDDGRG